MLSQRKDLGTIDITNFKPGTNQEEVVWHYLKAYDDALQANPAKRDDEYFNGPRKDRSITIGDTTYTFKLRNYLIHRKRVNTKNTGGYRFEILGQSIAQGGFGVIFDINTTLDLQPNHKIALKDNKQRQKERVVKIQEPDAEHTKTAIEEEDVLTAQAGHLKSKPSTFVITSKGKTMSQTVMKKASDMDLFDFTEQINAGAITLTPKELIRISQQCLFALHDQVHANSIIHRDIKPENIMIHLDPDNKQPPEVVILDFGLAKQAAIDDKTFIGGTPIYVPREQICNVLGTNEKSDIHSMGVVIAELWGIMRTANSNSDYFYETYTTGVQFDYTQSRIKSNSDAQSLLKDLLNNMTHKDRDARCTISDAIAVFNQIALKIEPTVKQQLTTMTDTLHTLKSTLATIDDAVFSQNAKLKQERDQILTKINKAQETINGCYTGELSILAITDDAVMQSNISKLKQRVATLVAESNKHDHESRAQLKFYTDSLHNMQCTLAELDAITPQADLAKQQLQELHKDIVSVYTSINRCQNGEANINTVISEIEKANIIDTLKTRLEKLTGDLKEILTELKKKPSTHQDDNIVALHGAVKTAIKAHLINAKNQAKAIPQLAVIYEILRVINDNTQSCESMIDNIKRQLQTIKKGFVAGFFKGNGLSDKVNTAIEKFNTTKTTRLEKK